MCSTSCSDRLVSNALVINALKAAGYDSFAVSKTDHTKTTQTNFVATLRKEEPRRNSLTLAADLIKWLDPGTFISQSAIVVIF